MDILKFKKTGDVYFDGYEENGDIKSLKAVADKVGGWQKMIILEKQNG